MRLRVSAPTAAGLVRASRRAGTLGLLVIGLGAVFGVAGWLVPPPLFIVAVAAPIGGVMLLTSDAIDRRLWIAYIVGFVGFAYLRGIADEAPFPTRFDYVIELERLAFGGIVPTLWLQERFYRLGDPTTFDRYALFIHFSYFFLPHLVAFAAWRRGSELFRRYVAAALGTYYAALAVSVVLPTAPPWLAAQTGRLPHVYRVAEDVLRGATPEAYDYAYAVAGTNPVAAMPSLHLAIALLVAIAAARMGRIAGLLGSVYALSMGLVLVYAGEHYVLDLVAGAVTALLAWRAARRGGTPVTERPRSLRRGGPAPPPPLRETATAR